MQIIDCFRYFFSSLCSLEYIGQHGHLSGGLHPAHAHMHGGWYASGMAGLGASGGLQGGFSSGGLSSGVVPHSQSYHLGISSMVSLFTYVFGHHYKIRNIY